MASSILTKSPSALVTTPDLMGAAFDRVGVFTNSSGMSHTVVPSSLLLLYARTDTGVRSGVVKALAVDATRAERAAIEASDLIFFFCGDDERNTFLA
jgi:hypothetical protein